MTKYEYTEVVEDNHSRAGNINLRAEDVEAEIRRPLTPFSDALTKASLDGWEMVGVYGMRPHRSALMRRAAAPASEDIPPALFSWDDLDRCRAPGLTIRSVAGKRAWLGINRTSALDAVHIAALVEMGDHFVNLLSRTLVPTEGPTAEAYHDAFKVSRGNFGSVIGKFVDDGRIIAEIEGLCSMLDVKGIGIGTYGSQALASRLLEAGRPLLSVPINGVGPAIDSLAQMIWSTQLMHDGDPIMLAHFLDLKAPDEGKKILPISRHPVGSPLRRTGTGLVHAAAFANAVRIESYQKKKEKAA